VIAVLPLSRCLIEQEISICDSLTLFPPGEWEGLSLIGELPPPVSAATLATNLSGISPEIIETSALVVYRDGSALPNLLGVSHKNDLFLLEKLAAQCESLLDITRFDKCQLDLPDTLFGRVGTWDNSNGASGAVFFDLNGNETHFVGGRYLVSTVTAGIGLDFYGYRPTYQHRKDEIGNVVKQALTIFRHALEANDWTSKYLHCIRLFEVLADPFQLANSNKWEKVRSKLCAHLAKDRESYFSLTNKFKLLGNVGEGGVRGLRERIVHHGELIENIFDSSDELRTLFKEIQGHIHKVLVDLMRFDGGSWQKVDEWRSLKLDSLGIST
jgi:hypothetical protein